MEIGICRSTIYTNLRFEYYATDRTAFDITVEAVVRRLLFLVIAVIDF